MKIVFMSSNAVAQNRISEVVGYLLDKGNFNTSTENLPPIIAILGEANTANQSGLSTAPYQITSAQQAGAAYGYGSPIHSAARILFPLSGGGVSCPVIVYPQASSGAVANVQTITVTGTATGNGTVYVNVAGRSILDGASYAVNILTGDTPTAIGTKISNAINASLGAPTTAAPVAGVVTCTAKWTGLTTQDIKISVDTGVTATGCTFAIAQTVAGTGTPAVTTSLNMFGSQWNNIVLNTYGLVSATIGELETFNGGPDPINPTGRYIA
jgi:phage tail sheath gpL-like